MKLVYSMKRKPPALQDAETDGNEKHLCSDYNMKGLKCQWVIKKVKETHGESKFAKEYLACIEAVKIHFEVA